MVHHLGSLNILSQYPSFLPRAGLNRRTGWRPTSTNDGGREAERKTDTVLRGLDNVTTTQDNIATTNVVVNWAPPEILMIFRRTYKVELL